MDKISKLQREIEDLKNQKEEAEKFIELAEEKTRENYAKIAEEYKNFYINNRRKDFVLIDRFPNMAALNVYARRGEGFPLYNDGELSVTELAEIIKHLFQFKRQQEYKILTIGATERHAETVYGGVVLHAIPHLYFLIGNDRTLEPFIENDGCYNDNWRLHNKIYLEGSGKDLISIELNRTYENNSKKRLDIDCFTGTQFDSPTPTINYYDFEENCYKTFNVSNMKNIFTYFLMGALNSKNPGIKDVLDFKVDYNDTFIAKVLISIIMYKRNNGLKELCEEDYNHIFKVLFNEEANIIGDINKDIPKHLVYVPSQRERRIFVVDPRK